MTALGAFVTARLDEYGDGDQAADDPASRAAMDVRVITALGAITDLYEEAYERARLEPGVHDGRDDDERLRDEAVGMALEDVMLHVASVWVGHPDFDSAWLLA